MHSDFDFDAYLRMSVGRLTAYCAAIVGTADAEDAEQDPLYKDKILDRCRASWYNKTNKYAVEVLCNETCKTDS